MQYKAVNRVDLFACIFATVLSQCGRAWIERLHRLICERLLVLDRVHQASRLTSRCRFKSEINYVVVGSASWMKVGLADRPQYDIVVATER